MADASDTPAVGIGEAIQRGVALLAQQSVATPTFTMTAVTDLYREGVRATKSRAPAARVLEALIDGFLMLAAASVCLSPGLWHVNLMLRSIG